MSGEALTSINGYSPTTTFNNWVNTYFPSAQTTTTIRQEVMTWIPPQAAVPSVSAIPPTPAQINYLVNNGWRSWAMSVEQLLPGSFIEYTVAVGVSGSFVGVGRSSQSGNRINTFSHGVLVDGSGIWVYESGVKIVQLRSAYSGSTIIRIYRQSDNSIVYLAVTGAESLIHKSSVPAMQVPLYGHGYLYSSGDTINSAAIKVGEVQFGSV